VIFTALWRWGPPAVWMAVISLGSTDLLAAPETSRFIGPLLRWLFPAADPATLELVHSAIRKLGHMAEFGLLALLWYRTLTWGGRGWQGWQALRALAYTVGFAVLDEIHQAFELTRTGSPVDVAWDSLGAAAGLLIRRLVGRFGSGSVQPERGNSHHQGTKAPRHQGHAES
jgi:VanZ family protein